MELPGNDSVRSFGVLSGNNRLGSTSFLKGMALQRIFPLVLAVGLGVCTYSWATEPVDEGKPSIGESQNRDLPSLIQPKPTDRTNPDNEFSSVNAVVDKTDHAIPAVRLTNDLLYQILSADIAEQRGLNLFAFENMMETAKQTKDPRLAKRATEIAVKARNAREALQAVRLWHELAPQSAEAEKFLIGLLILENQWDEVKDQFASRLAAASVQERPALFYQYQQILASTKNRDEAFSIMEEVVKPYDTLPEAHVALAVSALMKNDPVRAKEESQKALALKPDSEMAVLTLAQASADTNEAVTELVRFLKQYPASREVRISLARLFVGQKKYKEAQAEFERLLQAEPNDLMAIYSLGLLSIQQNDYASAENYLKRYLRTASSQNEEKREETQVLFLLSQLAEEQHLYDKALQWLSQIDVNDEDEVSLTVSIRRAQLYAKKGNVNRMRKILAQLESENPYDKEKLLLTEAQIFREIKKPDEALNVLKKGLVQFPNSTSVLYDYALTAESLGRYTDMENSLNKIIGMDPYYQQAYNALGYSLADRNIRLEEAYGLIEKAMKLSPDDPFITDSLGWVLYRQGKLAEAEKQLRRALELRPENEIAIHLAEVLWVSGQQQEALSLFKQVKSREPKNELLKETLTRLNVRL